MRTPRRTAVLALMAAVAGGCARVRGEPHETDEGPEIDALLQRYRKLVLAGDYRRITAMFEPDGAIMHAGDPSIRGHQAIARFLAGFASYKVLDYAITPLRTVVAGNTATQVGTFWQKVRIPDGKVVEVNGRFDVEWGREASGKWLIRRMGTGPPE